MVRQRYDYDGALADLDRLHREGKLTDGQYELHKRRLIDEATAKPRSAAVTFLIWSAVAVVGYLLLRMLATIIDNMQ